VLMLGLRLVGLFGSPVLLAIAWWRWWGDDRPRHSGWRTTLLLVGLSAASADVAIFWISVLGRWAAGHGTQAALTMFTIAGIATFYLELAGLVGALLGHGRGRLLTLVAVVSSFIASLPIAF
jgi:hypothetical protein